jgi:tRNA(His) guanylyltransferase
LGYENDHIGFRMKDQYEDRTRFSLPRRTYSIIRIDGKAFHTFTKGFERPYDTDLMDMMDTTARELCKSIQGAQFAYTQSDEISILLTDFDTIHTDAWFDGNIQKIVSISASIATAEFNYALDRIYVDRVDKEKDLTKFRTNNGLRIGLALFDSRVFTIPDGAYSSHQLPLERNEVR